MVEHADTHETRRMVDRAKGVLMDDHGLSEAEALRFMVRSAMGRRARMVTIAREVTDGALTP